MTLPEDTTDWSLTSLQLALNKIGPRIVDYARAIPFALSDLAD